MKNISKPVCAQKDLGIDILYEHAFLRVEGAPFSCHILYWYPLQLMTITMKMNSNLFPSLFSELKRNHSPFSGEWGCHHAMTISPLISTESVSFQNRSVGVRMIYFLLSFPFVFQSLVFSFLISHQAWLIWGQMDVVDKYVRELLWRCVVWKYICALNALVEGTWND